MEKIVLKMIDGGLIEIYSDSNCLNEGCVTCGQGARYAYNIGILLTKYKIDVHIERDCQCWKLSEEDLIGTFTTNIDKIKKMSELEFANWIKEEFKYFIKDEKDSYKDKYSFEILGRDIPKLISSLEFKAAGGEDITLMGRYNELKNNLGRIYRHFKGNLYMVNRLVYNGDAELCVEYTALYDDCKTWTRGINEFLSEVPEDRRDKTNQKYRFELVVIKNVSTFVEGD